MTAKAKTAFSTAVGKGSYLHPLSTILLCRPVIAAILALVSLAIGFSEGAIIASELAIVVIGGLTTSTFLTLLIVPVMFSLLDRSEKIAKSGCK